MSKKDMPTIWEIVDWWNENKFWGKDKRYDYKFLDLGESDCWACGRYDPKYSDIFEFIKKKRILEEKYHSDPDKYIIRMWENASLERHHIIPKSLGGEDIASNLFLLCNSCHEKCPHVADENYFSWWVSKRKETLSKEYLDISLEVLEATGYKDDDDLLNKAIQMMTFDDPRVKEAFRDKLSFHGLSSPKIYFRDQLYCVLTDIAIEEIRNYKTPGIDND